jgi:intracellular sulfur oxidation DsrE/DsrF family protein
MTSQPNLFPLSALLALALISTLAAPPTGAGQAEGVEALLAAEEPPAGVVFDIATGDDDALVELLPRLKADIERLRSRFPDLPVAIVTHGTEQFALTRDNRDNNAGLHAITEELVTDGDVDIHVCGTHAGWFDVLPEDFPDYVDVAAAGPAQINDYRALDYVLIVLP